MVTLIKRIANGVSVASRRTSAAMAVSGIPMERVAVRLREYPSLIRGCMLSSLTRRLNRRPAECLVETNALKYKRRVAYYMLPDYMERVRGCHMFMPEDLLVTGLTDINVAFINFGEDFKLVDAGGDIVHRLAKLRLDHPGLHVSIAIGGWTFNEGETADYWSKSE